MLPAEFTPVGFDTEFVKDPLLLISIGLVARNGETYYAVNSMMPTRAINRTKWLMENVWPKLPLTESNELNYKHPDVKPPHVIAHEVREFLRAIPNWRLVTYFGSSDDVLINNLFAFHRPLEGWNWRSHDIEQERERLDITFPPQTSREHHALDDAAYNLEMYDSLVKHEQERAQEAA